MTKGVETAIGNPTLSATLAGLAVAFVVFASPAIPAADAAGAARDAGARWVLVDLGTLGGVYASAVDVNERGQIVGWSLTKERARRPFLWENGRMRDLGDIGEVIAINERSQILGHRQVWERVALSDQLVASRGFVWERGHVTRLRPIGGRALIEPRALNDRGEVIGVSSTRGGRPHGFFWENGHMTDLGANRLPVAIDQRGLVLVSGPSGAFLWQDGRVRAVIGGCLHVWAMNERGLILGGALSRDGANRVCVWQNGRRTILPTLVGDATAYLVNDLGWILGESYTTKTTPRVPHYVVWRSGKIFDLGAYAPNAWGGPAEIFRMNNRGLVVWNVDDYKRGHIFVWDGSRTTELPTLGGKAVMATAIDDRGQIVGLSQIKSGRAVHAVMWSQRTAP